MTSTPATCTNPTAGGATATPVGTNGPWSYAWSSGTVANQPNVNGPSSVTGLTAGTVTVTVTDASGCTSSASISIGGASSANAGPDKTLTCVSLPGGIATMAALGTGVWSIQAGNPGAATTINAPTTNNTTISGFTAPGTYNYIWTSGGCSDVASVIITAKPNASFDQTICPYTVPSMNGSGGAGTWTAISNNPTPAPTIVSPTVANTNITGFVTPGSYRFVWTVGTCSDTMIVSVTPKPSAGPDQNVCINATTTMAATGAGVWSLKPGNPAIASITAPSSPVTTITGLTVAGVYNIIWTVNGCTDTVAITAGSSPNSGNNQVVSCAVLPGGIATMNATGAGTWSQSGNPGTSTITAPNTPGTTITNFSVPGVYTYTWTTGSCSATATVTVSGQPDAGTDKTLACIVLPGGTATMTATASTGNSWSQVTPNPGNPTITNNTLAVTTITNFTVAGTYGFIWSNSGCADTVYVTVTAKPSAGIDQTICQYTTATMAGVGAGTWMAPAGNPATATITTPSSATTTITNFTAAGLYYFIWTVGSCTDTMTVTVTAKPDAGNDQTICQFTTATMTAAGAGIWSTPTGNPATTSVTTPASGTTTITGFTVAGAYKFIWTANGCSDTTIINVTAKPSAGPDQSVCALTTVTMAGAGIGIWTAPAGNPATASITTPSSGTTTITNLSASGVYYFIWTVAGCTDTMTITVSAKPDAGNDQTICQYNTATMTGVGAGAWSTPAGNPATTSITTPASGGSTITGFTAAGAYKFIWTVNGCPDTTVVNVTAKPAAGPDQNICAFTTVTMAGAGTGVWTAPAGNPATASITTPSSATTSVTNLTTAGVYYFIWTVSGCPDTMTVTVAAKPNAGNDQTICQFTTATMTAIGAGVWSTPAGNPATTNIATPASGTTSITGFTVAGAYKFIWTVNGCDDTIAVNVSTKPNAGNDQTICQFTTISMTATGTGIWTAPAGNPATAIITSPSLATTTIRNFTAPGIYYFIWTAGGCPDTMTVTVTPKPDAGNDQTICQNTDATMAGTGTGVWSTPAGNPATTIITTPALATTIITGFTAAGAYKFIWTVNGCDDTTTVNVSAKPAAGPDQTVCQFTTATMAGVGTGIWTAPAGNPATAIITTPSSGNTSVTGLTIPGTYNFIWTIGGCADSVIITVTAKPDAGGDQTICQYTDATMTAVGAGLWSTPPGNPAITIIASPSSGTSNITGFTVSGVYQFIWTVNGCPDTTIINVTAKPVAGADQNICENDIATMTGVGPGIWSIPPGNPAPTSITSSSSGTTTIAGFTVAGVYNYIWTVNGCADSVIVNVTAKPDAGIDQTICQYTDATMAATGNGVWSTPAGNPAATTISASSSATTTITGFTVAGSYIFIWTVNGCNDSTVVNVTAKPVAGLDQTICQYTDAIMAASGGGVWSTPAGNPAPTVINTPGSGTTTITGFTIGGAYIYIWTVNGCDDTTIVNVTAKPDAGADQTICEYTTATIAGIGAGAWSTPGVNPAITNIASPSTGNTSITGFDAPGLYTYIWSVNGCSDTMVITVTAKPDAGPDQIICLNAGATMAAVGSGTWSTPGGNPATTIITTPTSNSTTITGFSAVGTYFFIWTVNGCDDTVSIVVNPLPEAGPDQNLCLNNIATMAGTGVGIWSALATNPNPTVITNTSSPNTTIIGFNIPGIYSFVYMLGSCSDTVNITINAKPDAGPDQTICQYTTATLAGVGAGTWSTPTGNPSGTNIATPSSNTTVVSGFIVAGAYKLIWTVNGCDDTMIVNVTPKPDAGPDQVICQYTATNMAGAGSGFWSPELSNPAPTLIVSPTSNNTSITGFNTPGTYGYVWTVNGCADTMSVDVTAKPDAGNDQTICQYTTAAMNATGAGSWSSVNTNPATATIANAADPLTIISGFTLPGNYNFVWAVNGCTDTTKVTVTAKPDAGQNQTICQYTSTTLAGQGTGTWTDLITNPATVTITSVNSGNTSVTGFGAPGIYSFIWTVNGCTDTVDVSVNTKPDAGQDQSICQNTTATMAAFGLGQWSDLSTNPSIAAIASPSSPNTSITGLTSVGIYSFVWTVNGCTDTVDVVVNEQPAVSVNSEVICLGNTATLTATASPTGGAYLWTTTEVTDNITVNPPSTTSYGVTYSLGICSAQARGTVTVNTLPVVSVSTVNTICTANNGVAIANVTGNAPYTYSWTNTTAVTDTARGLSVNTYAVIVTDVNGCTATASGNVALSTATIPVNLVSIHDLKCHSDSTGSITINAIDSGTLVYAWSDGHATGNISNLPSGGYGVTVTDQFGCTGTAQYTVNEPVALTLSIPNHVDATCPGVKDGSATGLASGGSGAYAYAWDTSPGQNTVNATGLGAGLFTLTVTDDSSCIAVASVTLTEGPTFTFGQAVTTDASCFGSHNGSAQVAPQNGQAPYLFQWNDSASQTSNPATALDTGTYSVIVTDAKGCIANTSVAINQPTLLTVAATHTDLTCFENNTGTAKASATGGTLPYLYVWNTNDSVDQINSLSAATYTVTVSDGHGCSATAGTTTDQPTAIAIFLYSVGTNCANTTDGTITVTSSGGSGSAVYSLKDITGNTIQSNNTGLFTGLGSNIFTVSVADVNGCNTSDTITVPRAPFNVYSALSDSTSCYGSQYKDGAIHLQGFTILNGPFQFSVDGSPLQYTPDFFDLAAGTHSVKIQDAHGCDTTFTVGVGEPLPASVDILPGDSTIAMGSSLQLSTAFEPYSSDSIKSYAWSPGEGLSCIDCPAPVVSPFGTQNSYTVTVTYNQGCLAIATVRINVEGEPPVFVPNAFTPNGDGYNDVLYVYGEGIKTMKMSIFNRWGEKVYESDNQSDGWDGAYKGVAQPAGVYVYTVDLIYLNNRTRLKEGSITLIR